MRFHFILALVALLLVGPAAAVGAQEHDQTGRLTFVHSAEGIPAYGLELVAPPGQGSLVGMWAAEPGTTLDLAPDSFPLTEGRYELTVLPPDGAGTDGREILRIDDLLISPGFTTVVTAYADQIGRSVFQVETAEGTSARQSPTMGVLVVENNALDTEIDVVVSPAGEADVEHVLGTAEIDGLVRAEVDAGTYTLLLKGQDGLFASSTIDIEAGQVTRVRSSDFSDPKRPPEGPSPRPTPIPIPNRVETGGGGAAPGDEARLLGAVATLMVIAGAALTARPNRAAR